MRSVLPILAVIAAIVLLWYAASVWLNAPWVYDQAARAGESVPFSQLLADTQNQSRPVLPPPHQVGAALWDGIAGQAISSKRSLVYHGWVTLQSTLMGFALGVFVGTALAVAIVHSRVMDQSVMPWAVISQTIPIVALAPMIVVLSNSFWSGALPQSTGLDSRSIAKAIISAYLSFFPVLVGMVKGLRSPDAMQLDLLQTYGATKSQTFSKLRLPAAMPYFFASLKVAIAASLIGAIVGELPTGAIQGLGARMLIGSQFGEPLIMWSALFASAILAGFLILIVGYAERFATARKGGVR
jgi:NitT/TauT family transport system permease protein